MADELICPTCDAKLPPGSTQCTECGATVDPNVEPKKAPMFVVYLVVAAVVFGFCLWYFNLLPVAPEIK